MNDRRLKTLLLVLPFMAAVAMAQTGYTPDIAEFDGTSTLAFGPSPAFDLSEGGTVEFWVVPDWQGDPGYDPVVIANSGPAGASWLVAVLRDRDGLGVLAGDEEAYTAFDFSDGELHHVALTYLEGSLAVFIDGEVRGTHQLNMPRLPSDGLWVGTADGASAPFAGAIAALRIWQVALGQEAIVRNAMADVLAESNEHPAFESLAAVSDFTREEIIIAGSVDPELLEPDS